jgi:hypothetical protein
MAATPIMKCFFDVSVEGAAEAPVPSRIRVSSGSTATQVIGQVNAAMSFDASTRYQLLHDGTFCDLSTIVDSCTAWLRAGDIRTPCEYASSSTDAGYTILVQLVLKVLDTIQAVQTVTTTGSNPSSVSSGKQKREHTQWQKLGWEVRVPSMAGVNETSAERYWMAYTAGLQRNVA